MKTISVPNLTSAEQLLTYPPGEKMAVGKGKAWQDAQISLFSLTAKEEAFDMPAVSEPFIAWVSGGEAITRERELGADWVECRVRSGSLYLTMSGAPYEFKWERLSPEPLEIVLVLLSLPVFEAAVKERHGDPAEGWHFRNTSGVEDAELLPLLKLLKREMDLPAPSKLLVSSVAQLIAVHLARNYIDVGNAHAVESSSLPSYKLRLVTNWISEHLAEPFSLSSIANLVGISEFHFNRLFKQAMGMPPSQYQIKLRMETARRQLRETDASIVAIANNVGYSNASHFSLTFKKETGLSPSAYRRQR